MAGRAQQDDGVALVDELRSSFCSWMTHVHVPSMTSRPRCSARAITSGVTPWARMTTAAPRSTSSSVSTVWMPWPSSCGDDALVVDNLAKRMGGLALCRGEPGVVDRLADPIAEPGPACDADLFDRSHVRLSIAPQRPARPRTCPSARRRVLRPGLPVLDGAARRGSRCGE